MTATRSRPSMMTVCANGLALYGSDQVAGLMDVDGLMKTETLLDRRRRLLGPNVPTFYDEPVHPVRGKGVWLWDRDGRKYLDCYNNVPHVGHCHPDVVDAIATAAATLNTHTRYLDENLLEYLDRLTGKFGSQLESAIMVCSGSEANDVALRMAQAATGKTGIIATDCTYHGNTALVSQINSRHDPIGGYVSNIRLVPRPAGLVSSHFTPGDEDGGNFARAVADAIVELDAEGHGCAALIVCPYFANEGFPQLNRGYLDATIDRVRDSGGMVIADEVQPGFGRLGTHWWGHERLGFEPDIVTLGKPMANGHPVAAVITSCETMSDFRSAFRYFNTFGGNQVSVAAAAATMTVIEEEGLLDNSHQSGTYALEGVKALAAHHSCLAAVRGAGLFFGCEICRDDGSPDTRMARRIPNEMRKRGVLMNTTGPFGAVLKIRPPMPIGRKHFDLLLNALDDSLKSLA